VQVPGDGLSVRVAQHAAVGVVLGLVGLHDDERTLGERALHRRVAEDARAVVRRHRQETPVNRCQEQRRMR